MKVQITAELKAAIDKFIFIVNTELKAYTAKLFPSQRVPPSLNYEAGQKYVRVWRSYSSPDVSPGKVAYAFIDIVNGDILKPASWRAPAKHARGNVYLCDYLATAGPYGLKYLKDYSGPTFIKEGNVLEVVKDMLLEDRLDEAAAFVTKLIHDHNFFAEATNE